MVVQIPGERTGSLLERSVRMVIGSRPVLNYRVRVVRAGNWTVGPHVTTVVRKLPDIRTD
jgi:hypothetical protein